MRGAMYQSVRVALAEVGYLEKESRRQLDERTANAGDANYTKYARDMDGLVGFYRGWKQGMPWCDVFVDWCFVQAYGARTARKLLCQPLLSRGAGCKFSLEYYEEAGRCVVRPRAGDQIFFRDEKGRICHTGIVVAVEDGMVHTVEGNTSDEEGIVANGGCVRRKQYPLDYPGIAGYGRPDYAIAE